MLLYHLNSTMVSRGGGLTVPQVAGSNLSGSLAFSSQILTVTYVLIGGLEPKFSLGYFAQIQQKYLNCDNYVHICFSNLRRKRCI